MSIHYVATLTILDLKNYKIQNLEFVHEGMKVIIYSYLNTDLYFEISIEHAQLTSMSERMWDEINFMGLTQARKGNPLSDFNGKPNEPKNQPKLSHFY